MTKIKRASGLDHLGAVSWGTHFCHLYEDELSLYNVVVPFLKAGLLHNEYCVWVTPQYLEIEKALAVLRAGIHSFDKHVERSQVHIVRHDDWYLRNGQIDPQEVFRQGLKEVLAAEAKGFDGFRITGDAFWVIGKKEWLDFAQYESTVSGMIEQEKIIALCTYPALAVTASEISDIAQHHHSAFLSRHRSIEAIEFREVAKAEPLTEGL
jgi:two-component system, LuxR family, sensor kinase FixL